MHRSSPSRVSPTRGGDPLVPRAGQSEPAATLQVFGAQAGATHLKIHAADEFYEIVSLETIDPTNV